jgi:hypothetical protein
MGFGKRQKALKKRNNFLLTFGVRTWYIFGIAKQCLVIEQFLGTGEKGGFGSYGF